MGHEVTVFTGYPNYPIGKIFNGYDPKLLTEEVIDGVRILRSKLVAKPNTSMIKRLENALSYFFFGWINILFHKRIIGKEYDVVLGTSGIVFNALLAQIYAAIIHVPFVLEVRDITYVQLQATGKSKTHASVKGMKHLELWLCKKAAKIVVVTNGFKKILVEDGIPSEKIEVITNGVETNKSEGAYDEGKRFTLSYFGTLGVSQNIVESFSYAAAIAKNAFDFDYLIIGDGAQRAVIEEAAKGKGYIRVLPGMSASELEPYYSETQLSVVTLRKSEHFRYTIPSKLFQIMGRGIAVLYIGQDGETAQIIRKYNAGITLTGDKASDLKELESFFSQSDWKEKLMEMGENGRKAVERDYSRRKLAERYIGILQAAAN